MKSRVSALRAVVREAVREAFPDGDPALRSLDAGLRAALREAADESLSLDERALAALKQAFGVSVELEDVQYVRSAVRRDALQLRDAEQMLGHVEERLSREELERIGLTAAELHAWIAEHGGRQIKRQTRPSTFGSVYD